MDVANIIIVALFFVTILWQGLRGLKRGFTGQMIHTGLTLVSAVVAFFAANSLVTLVLDGTATEAIGDLIVNYFGSGSDEAVLKIDELITNSNSLDWLLVLPTATVISPIVFTLGFMLINFVVHFVWFIIRLIFRIKKPTGVSNKNALGGVVGLIEGLLVAVIMLVPIVGVVTTADEGIDRIRERDSGQYTEFIASYDAEFGKLNDNLAIKTAGLLGGDVILNAFATVDVDDEKINLREEITKAVSIYMTFEALGDVEYSALNSGDKLAFESIIDELEKSHYLTTFISTIFSDIGHALEKGSVILEADPPYDMIINDVITIISTSNRENLIADMRTVLDVYFILSDSGVLGAFGEEDGSDTMRDFFIEKNENGETVIESVISTIESNEHTSPLVKTIVHMTITMLTGGAATDSNIDEMYSDMKSGFSEIVALNRDDYETEEEYIAARNEKITEEMAKNGVELEPEIADGIGNYIDENYGDVDEITDEQFNDIFLSYFDAYLDMQEAAP